MKRFIAIIIFLLVINLVYAKKVGTLTEVINPYAIEVDGGKLFIVEGPVIYIYSLNDLKLEKKFGRRGEGPEEFMITPQINMGNVMLDIYPEYLLVNSLRRISYFSKDGTYQKEIRANSLWGAYKPLGKQFVGFGSTFMEEGIRYIAIKLYDSSIKKGTVFFKHKVFINPNIEVLPFLIHGPAFYTCDNKMYIEKDKKVVLVYDQEGKNIASLDINQNYEKEKVTKEYKTRYLDYFKTEPALKELYEMIKRDIKFPKYFPGINFFNFADRKLYIIRWTGTKDKRKFAVFDLEGKFLKKALVPFYMKDTILPYAYAIGNGILYQLVENEDTDGKWDLYAADIK
jgi:hypothetical protein